MKHRHAAALAALGFLACHGNTKSRDPVDASIDSTAENKSFGAIDPSAMETIASPCSDFYVYACGGWEAKTRIPDDEGAWFRTWSTLRDASDETAAAILKSDASEPSRYPESRALGDFFAACLDTTAIDARGDSDLRTELDRIDTTTPEKAAASIARLRLLGVDSLFALEPEPDPENARVTIAVLRQPTLAMPESGYANFDAVTPLRIYATTLFALAGDEPDRMQAEAREAVDIEMSLAEHFESRAVFRDPAHTLRIVSAHDLPQIQPRLRWESYFAALGIAAPTRVHVATESYLRSLTRTLSSGGDLRAFLRWSLLRSMAPYLTAPYRKAAFDFARRETKARPQPPRARECTRLVESLSGDALARPFADAVVDPETAERALRLAAEVRAEIAREFMMAHRDRAGLKLARMRIEIDAPHDAAALPSFDREAFVLDVLRARENAAKNALSRIGRPTADRSGDIFFAPNASFDPRRNRIGISPALLLGASLPERPGNAELGSLGSIFGHEIVHAFDRSGASYDAEGTFDANGVEDARPNAETNAIARDLEDANLRSGAMLDETIADVDGVEIARRTLHHLRPDADDRAFFTAYAQLWCGKLRPEAMQEFVRSDAHPPPQARVNEVVRRSPAFAEAFSCK